MATATINGGITFIEGTTVGAYPATQVGPEGGAPSGTPTTTATVTGGLLVFTGLADGTEYVAYAASPNRYKRFRTDPLPPAVTGNEAVTTVASAGASYTVATASGVYDLTLTAPSLALTFPVASAGKSFSLVLRQDATGSRVVTWPACKWPGAAAPTLTTTPNGVDLVSFLCVNGTDWVGFPSGYDLR